MAETADRLVFLSEEASREPRWLDDKDRSGKLLLVVVVVVVLVVVVVVVVLRKSTSTLVVVVVVVVVVWSQVAARSPTGHAC